MLRTSSVRDPTQNKEKRIQERMERYDKSPPPVEYKYKINDKSQEIIDSIELDGRDLFEEAVKVADFKFYNANEIQKYYRDLEKREMEKSANKSYLNPKPSYMYRKIHSTLMKAKIPENSENIDSERAKEIEKKS